MWTVPDTAGGEERHRRAGEDPCRECRDAGNSYRRLWRLRRGELGIPPRDSRWHRYQLDREAFQELLAAQDGRCAICREPFKTARGTHVDHDHACSHADAGYESCRVCVRGLLCARCNSGIRILEDQDQLKMALEYLGRPPL